MEMSCFNYVTIIFPVEFINVNDRNECVAMNNACFIYVAKEKSVKCTSNQ